MNCVYFVNIQHIAEGIPFLSVHDEIIVKESDLEKSKAIMKEVLSKEFKTFEIVTK